MEKQFDFLVPNTGKLLLIWGGGLVVVLGAIGAGKTLAGAGTDARLVGMLIILVSGIYLLYRLSRHYGRRPIRVTVAADGLSVQDPAAGPDKHIDFSQIRAYRFQEFNGAEEFRLMLADGTKLKIGINNKLYDDQHLAPMVRVFEVGLSRCQELSGKPAAGLRQKTFFEKRVSTLVLVAMSVLLASAVVYGITSHKPLRGSSITAIGGYISYAAAWRAARERRNARP